MSEHIVRRVTTVEEYFPEPEAAPPPAPPLAPPPAPAPAPTEVAEPEPSACPARPLKGGK
jgi:hypothetical protein